MHQRFPILGAVMAAAVLVVVIGRPIDAQELPVLDPARTNGYARKRDGPVSSGREPQSRCRKREPAIPGALPRASVSS